MSYAGLTLQPASLETCLVDAGYFFRRFFGRIGRSTKFPPQFGQTYCKTVSAQDVQKVHSKVQITASVDSGGRSVSQHSQLGRSSNMIFFLTMRKTAKTASVVLFAWSHPKSTKAAERNSRPATEKYRIYPWDVAVKFLEYSIYFAVSSATLLP